MSIFNIFNGQLSEVIEWKNQETNLLWYKFPSNNDEIKNASKLIVAAGQGCVLVYEGKIENILEDEGIYNLKTDNHPFLTTLSRLRQNFESEHKVYIYFYRKAQILNQNWGTSNPIKYLDPEYKIPVELGLNGTFSYAIQNVTHFYQNIVANKEKIYASDLQDVIVNKIPQEIISVIASHKYSFIDIDSQLSNLSTALSEAITNDISGLGLQLLDFKILGTNFDDKTVERIGSIAEITSQNRAAQEAGLSYVELEKLRALRDAARNEGGIAGIGAQLGVGMEIGKQFDTKKEELVKDTTENVNADDFVQKLQKLNLLLKENIITQEEFDNLKKQILSNI
ncbi:SPFH domain-containing protein [Soonwooa sp.]|uniref:SPFH domain-containing protein n=1 Tax=Soonwooa sp. TaxID=1938592 RepID=UPI00262CED48|nr:SPFH domain-containing protein [Soonwooa sp.]